MMSNDHDYNFYRHSDRNHDWKKNIEKNYEDYLRKEPKCSCRHKHKVVIAIYKGEIEVLGKPENFELSVLNLDKELGGGGGGEGGVED